MSGGGGTSDHLAWVAARRSALVFEAAVPERGSGPPRGPSGALVNLSANRAARWEECQYSYYNQYVAKTPGSGRVSPAMKKGAAGHRVLEHLARERLLGRVPADASVTPQELASALRDASDAYHLSVTEHRELASTLNSSRSKLDFGRTISVEEPFELNVAEGVYAVGKLDRLDVVDEPATRWRAGGEWLHVVDYKTGDGMMTVDEATDDLQVGLYLAVLHEATQSRNVSFRLWYLAHGRDVRIDWSPDLHERTIARLERVAKEMQNATTFPGSVGPACIECEFRAGCPFYAAAIRNDTDPIAVAHAGDEELLKERKRCSDLAKLYENHRKECDDAIRARLVDRPLLVGAGLRAKLVTRTQYREPPLPTIVDVISRETGSGADDVRSAITGVDKYALKRYLGRLEPELRKKVDAELDALYEPFDSSNYVDVRGI